MLSKLKTFTAIRDIGSRSGLKMYRSGDFLQPINGTLYTLCLNNTFCNSAVESPRGDEVLPPHLHNLLQREAQRCRQIAKKTVINNNQGDEFYAYLINRQNHRDINAGGANPPAFFPKNGSVKQRLAYLVLESFTEDWKKAFEVFNWTKSLPNGFKNLPDSYNLMVDCLGKAGKFDLMWEMVEEMHKLEGYVTLATMTKVMRWLAKASRYEEAIELFRRIERFGVNKDVAALNMLIDALVKEQSVELAEDVFLEFKNHISPNFHTFDVLTHGWCEARNLEKAELTIEEMREHGFSPDDISYNSLVEAYCHKKDFHKVNDVLEETKENGCPPNAVTYTIVLQALGKAKDLNEALEVHKKIKRNGAVPDSSFHSSLIYILSKAGLNDAHNDMPEQGAKPNVLVKDTEFEEWSFIRMIAGYCNDLQEEKALKLLKEMEESQCKPDHWTYEYLLKMCCRLKNMEVISCLLNHMVKNDVGVGIEIYSILVDGLRTSGDLEHACSFFEEAVLRGFVPGDSLYKMLVEELERKYMEKEKERIEALMLQARQQVLSYTSRRNSKYQFFPEGHFSNQEAREEMLNTVLRCMEGAAARDNFVVDQGIERVEDASFQLELY